MSHSMMIWKKVINKRIRNETKISRNEFGFLPGKSMMKSIFCMRQFVNKYSEKAFLYVVIIVVLIKGEVQ